MACFQNLFTQFSKTHMQCWFFGLTLDRPIPGEEPKHERGIRNKPSYLNNNFMTQAITKSFHVQKYWPGQCPTIAVGQGRCSAKGVKWICPPPTPHWLKQIFCGIHGPFMGGRGGHKTLRCRPCLGSFPEFGWGERPRPANRGLRRTLVLNNALWAFEMCLKFLIKSEGFRWLF